jgi:hypothetical protein
MSTIFVGKWDRFATDFVVADKIGGIVGWNGLSELSEDYTTANGQQGKQQCQDHAIL